MAGRRIMEPIEDGRAVAISDIRCDIQELKVSLKDLTDRVGENTTEVTKLLAAHEERFKNLDEKCAKTETRLDGLVLKLWGLAAATFVALIGAAMDMLRGAR